MIEVNYLAVLVSAVAVFIIGMLWYGPVLGKYWMRLMNFTPESMKSMKMTPMKAMILGFIGTLLMTYVLAHFAFLYGALAIGVSGALQLAFWVWLGFFVPVTAGSWLWEGKSFKLFLFNAAYYLVVLIVAALIIVSM